MGKEEGQGLQGIQEGTARRIDMEGVTSLLGRCRSRPQLRTLAQSPRSPQVPKPVFIRNAGLVWACPGGPMHTVLCGPSVVGAQLFRPYDVGRAYLPLCAIAATLLRALHPNPTSPTLHNTCTHSLQPHLNLLKLPLARTRCAPIHLTLPTPCAHSLLSTPSASCS